MPMEPASSLSVLPVRLVGEVVGAQQGVSFVDICSARRTAAIVLPRQMTMWLARRLTGRSLPEIGRRLGGRDHTTVLHACRRIERLRADDLTIDSQLGEAQAAIMARAAADGVRNLPEDIDPVEIAANVMRGGMLPDLGTAEVYALANAVLVAAACGAMPLTPPMIDGTSRGDAQVLIAPKPVESPPATIVIYRDAPAPVQTLHSGRDYPPAGPLADAVELFLNRTRQVGEARRSVLASAKDDLIFAAAAHVDAFNALREAFKPYGRL